MIGRGGILKRGVSAAYGEEERDPGEDGGVR